MTDACRREDASKCREPGPVCDHVESEGGYVA